MFHVVHQDTAVIYNIVDAFYNPIWVVKQIMFLSRKVNVKRIDWDPKGAVGTLSADLLHPQVT